MKRILSIGLGITRAAVTIILICIVMNFSVQADVPFSPGVNSGLPNIYIWEQRASTPLSSPDMDNYSQKGVLINRTLIQLLRDMKD